MQTTIPRMPRGPIKVSDYSPWGGGGEGSCLLLELLRLGVLTDGVGLLQDLKEKKLLEEENGKDAATNGKVVALPSAPAPHTPPQLMRAVAG